MSELSPKGLDFGVMLWRSSGPQERKALWEVLGHQGHAFKEDCVTLVSFSTSPFQRICLFMPMLLFCCYDETPHPRQNGKAYLDLRFQRAKCLSWQQAAGLVGRNGKMRAHILNCVTQREWTESGSRIFLSQLQKNSLITWRHRDVPLQPRKQWNRSCTGTSRTVRQNHLLSV